MKTLIIDGNNQLYRSFWIASKNTVENSNLTIHLFLTSVLGLVKQFNPDKVYCMWDDAIEDYTQNFRRLLLPEDYKQNRDRSSHEQVLANVPPIREVLSTLGVHCMMPYTLEADDVIAWVSTTPGQHTIVSLDKDLLQLINDNVSVYNPAKKILVTPANFTTYTGVEKQYYIAYKALIGDSSDNIKGLYKVGPVKGAKLAKRVIDEGIHVLDEASRIIYERNLQLMDLTRGYMHNDEYVKIKNQFDTLSDTRDYKGFTSFCKEYELNEILSNKNTWYSTFFQTQTLTRLINQLQAL